MNHEEMNLRWLINMNKSIIDSKRIEDIDILGLLFCRNEDLILFKSVDGFIEIVISMIEKLYQNETLNKKFYLNALLVYIICIKYYSDSALNRPLKFVKILLRNNFSYDEILYHEIKLLEKLDYKIDILSEISDQDSESDSDLFSDSEKDLEKESEHELGFGSASDFDSDSDIDVNTDLKKNDVQKEIEMAKIEQKDFQREIDQKELEQKENLKRKISGNFKRKSNYKISKSF